MINYLIKVLEILGCLGLFAIFVLIGLLLNIDDEQ